MTSAQVLETIDHTVDKSLPTLSMGPKNNGASEPVLLLEPHPAGSLSQAVMISQIGCTDDRGTGMMHVIPGEVALRGVMAEIYSSS